MNYTRYIKLPRNRLIQLSERGVFKALRRLDGQRTQFERLENGELLILSDYEVALMFLKEKLVFDPETSGHVAAARELTAATPDPEADVACERYDIASRFIAAALPRSLRHAEAFLRKLPVEERSAELPSARSLLRWVKRLDDAPLGCASALTPRHHHKGTKGSRLDPRIEVFIEEAIDQVYMTDQRYPAAEVYGAVSGKLLDLAEQGITLKMPGASTIARRILATDGFRKTLKRHGRKAAEATFKPAGTYPEPDRPNQIWEIDHTRADVFTWDNIDLKRVLARAWITVIIDVYTRCIVGLHVSFDPPSYVSVMACLWRAILPKDFILEANGLREFDWPCMGLPESIIMDNGKEFHSESLKRALHLLGVVRIYAESGNPRRKPHVERVQGTMTRAVCHRMAGTTFSNIQQRGEADAQRDARHDIAFLRARLIEWVVNVYHLSPHSNLGDTPKSRWNCSVPRHPVSLPPDALDLRILLSPVIPGGCNVNKDGIVLEELTYWAPELTVLLSELSVEAIRVEVRVDPDDASIVWVKHPTRRQFLKATAREAGYAGIPRFVHRQMLKAKREREKLARANPDLIRAKAQLRANLATGHKQKRLRPGGSKEARLLGNNLEGAVRAVANGELAGAVPAWATPAALLDETTMTGDGWPVSGKAEQFHQKFSSIFSDTSNEQDAEAAEGSAQAADASAMTGSGTISTPAAPATNKPSKSERCVPKIAHNRLDDAAEPANAFLLPDDGDDWGMMEIPRSRGTVGLENASQQHSLDGDADL